MIDNFHSKNMVKCLHQFLFGVSREKFDDSIKKEDDKAKKLLDDIDDEPVDLLRDPEELNDTSFESDGMEKSNKMALELSKLNFKAKNLHTRMNLQLPDSNKDKESKSDMMQNFQQERSDKIMEIFNNLNLDEDEQDFLDCSQNLNRHKNLYKKSDKFGED